MINEIPAPVATVIWVKLSDGNSYSPGQLMLASGKEERARPSTEF